MDEFDFPEDEIPPWMIEWWNDEEEEYDWDWSLDDAW
jgi:hypothetical protein